MFRLSQSRGDTKARQHVHCIDREADQQESNTSNEYRSFAA